MLYHETIIRIIFHGLYYSSMVIWAKPINLFLSKFVKTFYREQTGQQTLFCGNFSPDFWIKFFLNFLNFCWKMYPLLPFQVFLSWKHPTGSPVKLFLVFLWMGGPLSSRNSNSWVKSCNNSSSSSSLSLFPYVFLHVESTVFLSWPESGRNCLSKKIRIQLFESEVRS